MAWDTRIASITLLTITCCNGFTSEPSAFPSKSLQAALPAFASLPGLSGDGGLAAPIYSQIMRPCDGESARQASRTHSARYVLLTSS